MSAMPFAAFATLIQDSLDTPRWKQLPKAPREPLRWDHRADGRNVAHQHIPGFVTGFEPVDLPFDTLDELLALPFVAHWADSDDFSRFSLAAPDPIMPCTNCHLMAEMTDGRWWVVATLGWPIEGLPEWSAK